MKKIYRLFLIILCFLGSIGAEGVLAASQSAQPAQPALTAPVVKTTAKPQVSKPVQTVQTVNDDLKNIKPISSITSNPPAKVITTNVIKTAPQPVTTAQPTQPQPVDFGLCSKFFKLDSNKLFYLTLASVNANRFEIKEIQSKSGYILFTVAQRPFLASVIKVDSKTSMLKITPCNNIYFFPVGIVQNMFKYIELNVDTPVEKLSVL